MALRNAFSGLATEGTATESLTLLRRLLNAASYARTASDQMRVVVDTIPTTNTQEAAVRYTTPYYGAGHSLAMDSREQTRLAQRAANEQMRALRWRFT